MELFKSIHKYMCEPLAINSYELFVTTIIVLLIHGLINKLKGAHL